MRCNIRNHRVEIMKINLRQHAQQNEKTSTGPSQESPSFRWGRNAAQAMEGRRIMQRIISCWFGEKMILNYLKTWYKRQITGLFPDSDPPCRPAVPSPPILKTTLRVRPTSCGQLRRCSSTTRRWKSRTTSGSSAASSGRRSRFLSPIRSTPTS